MSDVGRSLKRVQRGALIACLTDAISLESPIGVSCSLACLAFPPRLDLLPPDLLYSVPADQSSELRSRLRRLVVVEVVVVEQLLLLLFQ
ncbi:hypothetical protein Tco_0428137 [Tanacetum coccineum]